jgi:hypothetical protein
MAFLLEWLHYPKNEWVALVTQEIGRKIVLKTFDGFKQTIVLNIFNAKWMCVTF